MVLLLGSSRSSNSPILLDFLDQLFANDFPLVCFPLVHLLILKYFVLHLTHLGKLLGNLSHRLTLDRLRFRQVLRRQPVVLAVVVARHAPLLLVLEPLLDGAHRAVVFGRSLQIVDIIPVTEANGFIVFLFIVFHCRFHFLFWFLCGIHIRRGNRLSRD